MHSGDAPRHIPVLHTDGGSPPEHTILGVLRPQPGESVLDVTLGLGGHAASFLDAVAPDGVLTGLDADTENLALAATHLARFGDRASLVHMNFRDVETLGLGFDIVFADLGVSSPHFDDPARGFTFRQDAPLDMRFDRTSGETAAQMLAGMEEQDITEMFRKFGELREARRLAQKILKAIGEGKLSTTDDMKRCVEEATGYRAPKVLPQVFQSLRIAVNKEMEALEAMLDALPVILNPGGRAGFISYHSLEDRLVKHEFRGLCIPIKDDLTGAVAVPADWELLTPKAIVPSDREIELNPRSRSAKYRAIRRIR